MSEDRRWKPPKFAPQRRLHEEALGPEFVNWILNSRIAWAMARGRRKVSARDREYIREESHDGIMADLIYRTTDFAARCRECGCAAGEFKKIKITAVLLCQTGVITEGEKELVLQDIGAFE